MNEGESMSRSEALVRAQKKYDGQCRQVKLKFHVEGDADVLAKLETVANKQDYIRNLIRMDIARG